MHILVLVFLFEILSITLVSCYHIFFVDFHFIMIS